MCIVFHVKCPLFLPYFNKTIKISRKFVQWEPSASMRTEVQTNRNTNMAKLIVALRNFADAPNKMTNLTDLAWPPHASGFSPLDMFV